MILPPVEEGEVIVCAGPPVCLMQGDAAIENAAAGCPNCRHVVRRVDGTEDEFQLKAH